MMPTTEIVTSGVKDCSFSFHMRRSAAAGAAAGTVAGAGAGAGREVAGRQQQLQLEEPPETSTVD